MAILHDPAVRGSIETRLRKLTPDTAPRWGRMSSDQMLWHVNQALAVAVGELTLPPEKPPLPRAVIKFMVLRLPWMKNGPTSPAFVAKGKHDFEAERSRCLRLIDMLVRRPIDEPWPAHQFFGPMSGREVSTLHAKHLDHHLRQFGH